MSQDNDGREERHRFSSIKIQNWLSFITEHISNKREKWGWSWNSNLGNVQIVEAFSITVRKNLSEEKYFIGSYSSTTFIFLKRKMFLLFITESIIMLFFNYHCY